MRKEITAFIWINLTMFISACSGSPYRDVVSGELIENKYVSVSVPDGVWKIHKKYNKDKNGGDFNLGVWAQLKGVSYDLGISNYPFKVIPDDDYFDKNSEYLLRLKDEDMQITANDKEQGIGYKRLWVNYVNGLKCSEGVFSRSQGGLMASITSKNYSVLCGYYNKQGEKLIISIDYRYNYAAGPVRHQQDKDTPREELLTLEQAEQNLKEAVKKLVSTLKIKNMDRERMEREGLMHYEKQYEIFPY